MYLFEKVEQEAKAMTMTGGTLTVELDETVDYTALLLIFNFTCDTSQIDATKERILDWITSITVIGDDDKYVVNASAREIAFLHYTRTKRPVFERVINTDDHVQKLELPIYFGRKIGDTEYFLAKGQFSKLELNVKNDDSDTGNYFDAGTLEVRSYQFKDHTLTSKGVLRPKQVKEWVPASSTDSYTEELPDKHLIEKVIVEALPTYVARTSDHTANYDTLVDKLKLTYKGGDIVVFHDDIEELAWRNAQEFGEVEMVGVIKGQEADYWDSGVGYRHSINMVFAQDPSGAGLEPAVLEAETQRVLLKQQGTAADNEYYIEVTGYAYLDMVCFDFAPNGDMNNLYDPTVYKKGELKITAGSTAGKIHILVVEVVTSF